MKQTTADLIHLSYMLCNCWQLYLYYTFAEDIIRDVFDINMVTDLSEKYKTKSFTK